MTLSIDTGCIDARGRLAWDVLGLGGLGVGNVPALTQGAFDPAKELGTPAYQYSAGNRQVTGLTATQHLFVHAVHSVDLDTGDDIRDAANDLIYVEALIVDRRTSQAVKMGITLDSAGVFELGTAVGSVGLGMNSSRGLDGVNSNYGFTSAIGDRIMLAVDFPNELFWNGGNGVWTNGDPATTTGGAAIDASWTAAGAVMQLRCTGNDSGTLRAAWQLVASPAHQPDGFSFWPAS